MKLVKFAIIIAFLSAHMSTAEASQVALSEQDLLKIAGNKYASGELPLGDGHYVTDKPQKGYIYLCHTMNGGGGAGRDGNWIHGKSWNIFQKIFVHGNIAWNNAIFNNNIEQDKRVLSGNGLPVNHTTGIFPVQQSDPAYYYDRNPNTITAQTLNDNLPLNPVYSDEPFCMGGEAGIMLTGVPLFNGFDAGMRDAAAHEVQDSCSGHPQMHGQYHYHSLSNCIKDVSIKKVIGYALDGFPITGPLVAPNKYLTTENLDECHGITSEIYDGNQTKTTYHYVMTQDFPYSVSCFRGKPSRTGPSPGMAEKMPGEEPQMGRRTPPAEALTACRGKADGAACGFTSPRGDNINGTCRTPPNSSLACVPMHMR